MPKHRARGLLRESQQFSFAGADPGPEDRRCGRTPVTMLTPEQVKEAPYLVAACQVFREEVGRVFLPFHLAEVYRAVPHSLLDPQALGIHVPELAQALPAADPHRAVLSVQTRIGSANPTSFRSAW